ncbi:hypothetical protein NA56DRAFT_644802 [Hyaloscypha hepaticicola]|uniref:UBC core domain-containing protein n=1 Tax=Hyaloscypha hepaticicola TaxID=2082293 RepID=A0A2J6Q8M6_9HELO|nr:hypothetical protein NA56DRAFT_644802 [Hyaloscypha hepaticicola]
MSNPNRDPRSGSQGSEGSVFAHSSFSSSSPDLARVFVQLNNGMKIIVPIPQTSVVQVLHAEALKRAARVGVTGTLENTLLQTTGKSPVVLFGEDSLIEVLDLTEDNTLFLRSVDTTTASLIDTHQEADSPDLGAGSPPSGPGPSALFDHVPEPQLKHRRVPKIYVRWITLEAALEHSRLRRIPVDNVPISCDTTFSEFHRIAVERLCGSYSQGSCIMPRKLNLFLRECRLHTENNLAILKDLGPRSKHEPLDIFVEFTGPNYDSQHHLSQLSLSTDPKRLWSFDSTSRGMSTFITSLQILLKEIERGHCNLDEILEVLLELTHFPPLLLAFRTLHETGIDNRTPIEPLLLVASAFHALCRRMIPSKICQSSDSFLEGSRQIVFWIYSMRSEASLSHGGSRPLIHRVQIKAFRDGVQDTPAFKPFYEVEVPTGLNAVPKRFLVSVETGGGTFCQRLGVAFHEKSSLPWDFYFQPPEDWGILWDHKAIPMLHPNEFGSLMETTNSMDAFRMVGPLQLGACLAAELPVITLSSKGYVSRYDHEDLECSERSFVTWNAVEGRNKLPDNPGQFLSQKLDPILAERKKLGSWELDAWAEWTKTADYGVPDEAIVICVDTSSSMATEMPSGWIPDRSSSGVNPSRLTEVKEFFKNLSLRISALNLSTHLGLVTFSNKEKVIVKQPLTALHLNFNHQLDNIHASGSTAIFDALNKAHIMLADVKRRYPNTKSRIILLTDGEDKQSTIQPSAVSLSLAANDIVLDTVVIGSNQTAQLFKIARSTGGYAFSPKSQQALFQIFLLETVVDIRTRPNITKTTWSNWNTFQPKPADMANPYEFPPCRPHPNLDDYFIALSDAERFMNRMSRRSAQSSASVSSSSTRLSVASTITIGAGGNSRVLLSEIKAMIDNPHDYMDIYVSQSNMCFWKVVMQGPPDSPYANGTFLLYIEMGVDFPRRPPSARFITPMLHPNITKHGRVCHPIFDREWTPATRMYQVLQHLYGILMSLEARDAVDPLAALRFWSDEQEGIREVENYVNRFARRSRALHRLDIIGDDVSSLSSSVASSSASIRSGSTVTSTSLHSFRSAVNGQSQTPGYNPFSNPPGSRSENASSRASISTRSPSTTTTLASHLANQRRPVQPPPLMASQGSSTNNPISRVGADGRNRLSRRSAVASSADTPPSSGGSQDGSQAGSASSGRKLSRRASFFALLRNAGN